MKCKFLVAAVAFALATGPALAGHVSSADQGIFCATKEPGNPYSKYCDYLAWSGWRRRGAWDSSLDNACLLNLITCPMVAYRFRAHCQGAISKFLPS
jgi:hypothetical protein